MRFKVEKILGQQKDSVEVITGCSKKPSTWNGLLEFLQAIDVPEDFMLERDNDVPQVRDQFR